MKKRWSDELYHHGVKGQQWGVRNGPPYPIETGMKKGTKLASVSIFPDAHTYQIRNNKMLYTYNPKDKWDSKIYKGPFSIYKSRNGMIKMHEHTFVTVKDLKMPTSKERIDEFINLATNNRRMLVKDLKPIQQRLSKWSVGSKESRTVNLNKLKSDADFKAAYEIFNHAMENANAHITTRKYVEIMSTKYDAMVDDNNQGVYNRAHDPVIIFRANEVLKTVGSRTLADSEIVKNYVHVKRELNKKGEQIKL